MTCGWLVRCQLVFIDDAFSRAGHYSSELAAPAVKKNPSTGDEFDTRQQIEILRRCGIDIIVGSLR